MSQQNLCLFLGKFARPPSFRMYGLNVNFCWWEKKKWRPGKDLGVNKVRFNKTPGANTTNNTVIIYRDSWMWKEFSYMYQKNEKIIGWKILLKKKVLLRNKRFFLENEKIHLLGNWARFMICELSSSGLSKNNLLAQHWKGTTGQIWGITQIQIHGWGLYLSAFQITQ